jgi:hypothetical protein
VKYTPAPKRDDLQLVALDYQVDWDGIDSGQCVRGEFGLHPGFLPEIGRTKVAWAEISLSRRR